jgi:hypothetical protein
MVTRTISSVSRVRWSWAHGATGMSSGEGDRDGDDGRAREPPVAGAATRISPAAPTSPGTARALVEANVALVGIDALDIDDIEDRSRPAHRHPPPAQGDRPDRAAAGWPSGPGHGGPSVRTARRRRRPSSRPFTYRPASTAMTSSPSWTSAAISPITTPTTSGTSGAGDSVVVLVRASSSRRTAGLPGLADKARRATRRDAGTS